MRNTKKNFKMKIKKIYYYKICGTIKLHENEKNKFNLFKRFTSNVVENRNARAFIQNDVITSAKNLYAAFEIVKRTIKAKRFKEKNQQSKEPDFIDNGSNIQSFSFVSFKKKLKSRKLAFNKTESILLKISNDEKNKFNDSKPVYLELRDFFLKLIKKIAVQCLSTFIEE